MLHLHSALKKENRQRRPAAWGTCAQEKTGEFQYHVTSHVVLPFHSTSVLYVYVVMLLTVKIEQLFETNPQNPDPIILTIFIGEYKSK